MTRPCILLQALSGKGKTFKAAEGGKPYYLAAEPKCRAIVKLINPNAKVFNLDSREDYERAIKAVQDPRLVENGYDRIVLDSYSELTEFMPAWFGIGFPLQIQDYGTIGNKAMALVNAMLKSPIPCVIICRAESKEQGKVHRVVPGSVGKSAAALPAKCVLTAETRFDEQLGWVIDTTPDDYTQRSGLPWVPQIYQGSITEFLGMVERGPVQRFVEVPAHEAKPLPDGFGFREEGGDAVPVEQAPNPENDPKGYQAAAGEMFREMADEKKAEAGEKVFSAEVEDFVNAVADGPKPTDPPEIKWANEHECAKILVKAKAAKISSALLAAYLHKKGWMPDPKNFTRINAEAVHPMSIHLGDRATAFRAHLNSHFAAHHAA